METELSPAPPSAEGLVDRGQVGFQTQGGVWQGGLRACSWLLDNLLMSQHISLRSRVIPQRKRSWRYWRGSRRSRLIPSSATKPCKIPGKSLNPPWPINYWGKENQHHPCLCWPFVTLDAELDVTEGWCPQGARGTGGAPVTIVMEAGARMKP